MSIVGIIGAMEEELDFIRSKAKMTETKTYASIVFSVGCLGNQKIVFVTSGIGKVNAAVCAQILIDHFQVDKIINIGVAGAVNPVLNIGDIVISKEAVQHDIDTSEFGDPIGVIPRMKESYFKADRQLIELAKEAAENLGTVKVLEGRVASGDQFISSIEGKQRIWNHVQGDCAEMEGAAIAQVCYLNQVAFVLIRSISDNSDHSSSMDYEQFKNLAAENAGQLLYHMLSKLG